MKPGMLGNAGAYVKFFEENQEDYIQKAAEHKERIDTNRENDRKRWGGCVKTKEELVDKVEQIINEVHESPFDQENERFEADKTVVRNQSLKLLLFVARLEDEPKEDDLIVAFKMYLGVCDAWYWAKARKEVREDIKENGSRII